MAMPSIARVEPASGTLFAGRNSRLQDPLTVESEREVVRVYTSIKLAPYVKLGNLTSEQNTTCGKRILCLDRWCQKNDPFVASDTSDHHRTLLVPC